jgi:hypothetical protein
MPEPRQGTNNSTTNGRYPDPDGQYGDVSASTEGMSAGNIRLAQLRRKGLGQEKITTEMPADIICPSGFSVIDTLRNWGVQLGKPDGKRDLFFRLEDYPKGWGKRTNPDETSSVCYHRVDDKGRIRLTFFYERRRRCEDGVIRADTDSRILLEIHARFSVHVKSGAGRIAVRVTDANDPEKPIHTLRSSYNVHGTRRERMQAPGLARERAETWLDEHHPNWRDPCAYWET